MLKPAISLDAHMSSAEVLRRLALRGFWIDVNHPAARERVASIASRLGKSPELVAGDMSRDARLYGAAIRMQSGARVLWFAMRLERVLESCANSSPDTSLRDVLDLREQDAHPILQLSGETVLTTGVVMDNGTPVSVWLGPATPPAVPSNPPQALPRIRSGAIRREVPTEAPVARTSEVWPRMEAPSFVRAGQRFSLTVGLGAARQAGITGGPVMLTPEPGCEVIEMRVQLSAGPELTALDGWTRTLRVALNDISAAEARFELVGTEPADPNLPHLTMLEVRYLQAGTVCGSAAKPLVILHSQDDTSAPTLTPESSAQSRVLPIVLTVDPAVPDLTIEITKSDRTSTLGQFVCQCYSPHRLDAAPGPFPMDLGQDASTFARAIVDEVALFARSPLLESTLEGIGKLIAQRMPAGLFAALREVAVRTAPAAPSVMIVSAEPYVPWELAWIEPPIDATRPNFLGSQVILGRWLRDYIQAPPIATVDASRPAAHPSNSLSIRNVAVVAAWYKASSGLTRLRKAEAEVQALASNIDGITLPASAQVMKNLLQFVDLERGSERVGPMHALHFSGHGDFDPTKPDAGALYLEDGVPMRSTLFRATRFPHDHQPLMFLNACMLGIGGELLGDMAGFPGNSLRGGFGGVIGALWEIEDVVAKDVALEFWRRALPPPPAKGEPIGVILRDLRARYRCGTEPAPPATYLAYAYYGHPNLTLQRIEGART